MSERIVKQVIHGDTKVYGIIGCPVSHSLSPTFQNYFLELSQVNAVYVPFPVEQQETFSGVLQGLKHAGVLGLNITVPYKEQAFACSQPDQNAQRIGAVNTLYPSSQGWKSSNTDYLGFKDVIEKRGWDVQSHTALLLGAGGTARAIVHALDVLGIAKLYITNRSCERVQRLQAHIEHNYPNMQTEYIHWDEEKLQPIMKKSKLLINSTSIGLNATDQFPFEVCGRGYAIDAVYKASGQTVFRQAALQSGRDALDGLPMLLAQGAASFALWHQKTPDWLDTLFWLEKKLHRCNDLLWEKTA